MTYRLRDSRDGKWAMRNAEGVVTMEEWTYYKRDAAVIEDDEFEKIPRSPTDPGGIWIDVVQPSMLDYYIDPLNP